MKNFVKVTLTLFFLTIPCLMAFSACNLNIDAQAVRYELNGGTFTDEYKSENGITSDNAVKVANLNYYGGFSDGLPCEKDLVAPSNKVFAGWYISGDCTPDSYLTSETWEVFSAGIKDKTGDNVIYARWIDAGTKDILYKVDEEVAFSAKFIATNTVNGNMTNTTIVRFNVSKEGFEAQKSSLPSADDLTFNSVDYDFNGWMVENNGHYYDFKEKSHNETATNKMNAHVNANFDSENFEDFFSSENENVAYVLLMPKALTVKPWNKITISLDANIAGYDGTAYSEQVKKADIGKFDCTPDPTGAKDVWEGDTYIATYFVKLSLSIRFDMSYENVNKVIPQITMLNSSSQFSGWSFTIGENTYDFTEDNWNTYAKIRPSDDFRSITFNIKTVGIVK